MLRWTGLLPALGNISNQYLQWQINLQIDVYARHARIAAAQLMGCVRMTIRTRRGGDEALRERLRALAKERRRFGYRRLHVLLRCEG